MALATPDNRAPRLRPVPGWVALGLLVTLLGEAVALVLLIAIKNIDVLASVALTVAILAFLIQIVVFLAQYWMSHEQALRAEELHGLTVGLLGRVEKSADESVTRLRNMEEIRAVARTTVESQKQSSSGRSVDYETLVSALATLSQPPEGAIEAVERAPRAPHVRRRPQPERGGGSILETWPTTAEEAADALATLSQLSPLEYRQLLRFAEDEINSLNAGLTPGLASNPRNPSQLSDRLLAKGLLERRPDLPAHGNRVIVTLTDAGREAARLLTAHSPVPKAILGEAIHDAPPPEAETGK